MHPSFHFLSWSYFVCGFHTAFITLHLPAFVTDAGLNASHGATAIALIGLFNVLGSFYAGKLGGRFSKKWLLAGLYGLRAFGIILVLAVPLTPVVLYLFAAWMGLFWLGTVPLTQGLIGEIYGLRFAATLSGIAFLCHQVGSFIGVWLGGYVYAHTGSYNGVWWVGLALAWWRCCCACRCASASSGRRHEAPPLAALLAGLLLVAVLVLGFAGYLSPQMRLSWENVAALCGF